MGTRPTGILGAENINQPQGITVNTSARLISVVGSLAVVLGVASCGGDDARPNISTDAPAVSASRSTTTDAPAVRGSEPEVSTEHNESDVTFAQMMIIHHEGALEMAELAGSRAASEDVRSVAATIEAAQLPEIELMQGWLTAWDEPLAPSGHAGMDHGGMDMNGLSQEEVMAELATASGGDFDDQFLTAMIAHHEGAVMMAEQELDAGVHPDALALAALIIEDQRAEIEQMQGMLDNL